MKLAIYFCLIMLTACLSVYLPFGQDLKGQELLFGVPAKLTDSVNSASEEISPILSPGCDTLYFTRMFSSENTGGKKSGSDIWFSPRAKDGQWLKARNTMKKLNNGDHNTVVGSGQYSRKLYLVDSYSPPALRNRRLAISKPQNGTWASPGEVTLPFSLEGGFLGLYMAPTEDALLISMHGEGSLGEEDLYVSLKNSQGAWGKPIHLGSTVNTAGFEISPSCTPKKDTLFFASNGLQGYGSADIFYSVRLDSTWQHWSKPVNLGAGINSQGFDGYFYLSAKGEAFFASNREGGMADIYSAARIRPKTEEKPLLVAEDTVKKTKTQAHLKDSLARAAASLRNQQQKDSLAMAVLNHVLSDFVLYFGSNSSKLLPTQETRLDSLVALLASNSAVQVKITGHADNLGDNAYNLALSQKRAEAVTDYLVSKGVLQSQIVKEYAGATKPAADNATSNGRKLNRRVVVIRNR